MANITVHDAEQEGEADDREDGRIDLFVGRHGILSHHDLEVLCELVCLEERRWIELTRINFLDLQVVVSRRVGINRGS